MDIKILGYETLTTAKPTDIYEFVEPHPTGGTSIVSIYVYDILRYMDAVHLARADNPVSAPSLTDDDFLEEFISDHGAEKLVDLSRIAAVLKKIWWGERGPYREGTN